MFEAPMIRQLCSCGSRAIMTKQAWVAFIRVWDSGNIICKRKRNLNHYALLLFHFTNKAVPIPCPIVSKEIRIEGINRVILAILSEECL